MPRTKRLLALKRPKLRQSWSKYNLYNLSRVTTPPAANKTFFQQKWTAKSMLRSYHNPDVREGTWTRMFDRRLPAVVPMDHRYLAKHDGSEMASGRGMGMDKDPKVDGRARLDENGQPRPERRIDKTPYMHMTFHPLERRLDTSIFRALFASSVRQARQMVVHGFVKVNGKKMIYPSYQLNPGDMFSVDPERVLFATGARKIKKDKTHSPVISRWISEHHQELARQRLEEKELEKLEKEEEEGDLEDTTSAGAATVEAAESDNIEDQRKKLSKALKKLMDRANFVLDDSKRELSGKRQRELRDFHKTVKKTFSKLRGLEEEEIGESVENFETMLAEILTKVPADAIPESEKLAAATEETIESSNRQVQTPSTTDAYRARKDAELLAAALQKARENPIDVTKPYSTPWHPRQFLSAFAFIPRYLEVNHKICSAVYLRHPVARPGLAEVPTPFAAETMGLGFNWYLRRR